MARFRDRLVHAWSAFTNNRDDEMHDEFSYGASAYGPPPSRTRVRIGNERTILAAILTRISIDVSMVQIRHVRLDEDERVVEEMDSYLNECLKVAPNIDQGPRQFRQDIAMTLFDKGVLAIVPVDTTVDPEVTNAFDIKSMRVGDIVQWYPEKVKVSLFNQAKQTRQDVRVSKTFAAIVENPLYGVMNEPNSTLQRLIRKLNILDAIDEQSGSGKLDIIIQLPYVIKSEAKREQAMQRRRDIEHQLSGSRYGIAYTDGTEKVTQLNRPAENNLLAQVQYLHEMLYGQLGVTPEVMNGTADEAAMLNYNNRTIEPVVTSIVESMRSSFLTKTARTQGQSIEYFRDPFKLVPISQIAEIADKLTRNEILTSNEVRGIIGFRPAKDKDADKLKNSNMPAPDPAAAKPDEQPKSDGNGPSSPKKEGDSQNGT